VTPGRVLPVLAIPLLVLGLWLPVMDGLSIWGVLQAWSHTPERAVMYCAILFVAAVVFGAAAGPRDLRPMAVLAAASLVGFFVAMVAARGLGTPGSGAAALLVALALVGLGAWAAPIEWAQIQRGIRTPVDPPSWPLLVVFVGVTDLWLAGFLSFWAALAVVAGLALLVAVGVGAIRRARNPRPGS
jgi:hypothetical protein